MLHTAFRCQRPSMWSTPGSRCVDALEGGIAGARAGALRDRMGYGDAHIARRWSLWRGLRETVGGQTRGRGICGVFEAAAKEPGGA
jgi:hypothetical protein